MGPLLPLLPYILGALLIGAVAWWIKEIICDGKIGAQKLLERNVQRLREANNHAKEKLEFIMNGKIMTVCMGKILLPSEWVKGDLRKK